MATVPPRPFRLFDRGTWGETRRVADVLRKETIGGALLLGAAVLALIWANSPWSDVYDSVREFQVGPTALHLDLSLASWAADGLLAIFFFVAGLELKREFVLGDLRDLRRAVVPVSAAVGGVIVPAVVYLLVTGMAGSGDTRGWAIPTATDIAFALAVLAVVGRHLPSAFRAFLLTLAVVDDLLAIVIIATFYTEHVYGMALVGAAAALGAFTLLVRHRVRTWWLLLPLAIMTWVFVHASGVHATVAGVLLALAIPVNRSGENGNDVPGLALHVEHRIRPISAGVAVPVFALLSAGVTVGGWQRVWDTLTDPVAVGVVVALVIGKPIGILTATLLVARFTHAELDDGLSWVDVAGLSILGGIGFTVALLIGELAFGTGTPRTDNVKAAVLAGSLIAALIATVFLRLRNRTYRRLDEAEAVNRSQGTHPGIDDRSEKGSVECRPRAGPAPVHCGDMGEAPIDLIERAQLSDLLDELGPEAPTLLEPWTARDLAAHLVLREHDPLAGPGLVLPGAWARFAESRRRALAQKDFMWLVGTIRSGPPPGFFRVGWVRRYPNLNEFFVHHEDVRRANGRGPRTNEPAADEALWRNVSQARWFLARRLRGAGLELIWAGTAHTVRARRGKPTASIAGSPGELLLYLFGRQSAAHVEVSGTDEAIDAVRRTRFGM